MINLTEVRLNATTSNDELTYSAKFSPGLNVVNAPNSWGKSTLLQGIVFGLGLEGMFSASRQAPLGEAMTRVAEGPNGRAPVVESSVTVTLKNYSGSFLRARRFARSGDVGRTLIQTWSAEDFDELEAAPQIDTIVREAGSAVREAGFHRVLAEFMGLHLPLVPTFSGSEVPLYLELLFPLFYVEQKFGWSGVNPRLPTYLRVREPARRSVEFILGLSTLERIRQRSALRQQLQEVTREWESLVGAAQQAAGVNGWILVGASVSPTARSQRQIERVLVQVDDSFIDLRAATERWQTELEVLPVDEVPTAAERTEESRQQLDVAEAQLRRLGATARSNQEAINLAEGDLDAVNSRLAAIEADRRRFRDIRRLRTLGSVLDVPVLASSQCPTCEQDLDGRQVATGQAMSIDDSAALADAERQTLMELQSSLEGRLTLLRVAASETRRELSDGRERVRLLRDELSGPSAAPSYAEVANRLALQRRIEAAYRVQEEIETMSERLDQLAASVDDIRARLTALGDAEQSPEDSVTVEKFRSSFRHQLALYGLSSLPPSEVTIDEQTLLPANDGVELAFDVATGMSASDTIRTKWAYYLGLLEASATSERGHHAGMLILDEPRQQETDRDSLAEFLRRLDATTRLTESDLQIIYATSERPETMSSLLQGLSPTIVSTPGTHMLS